jgi:thiol-disulfide isomerase/thioredoxin
MMKRIFIILSLLAFVACDHIPENEREKPSENLPMWQGQYVLLEDFTGVKCVNCPAAAEQIEVLKTVFGDKLIVVGLHPQTTSFNTPIGTSPDSNGNNLDLSNAQAEEYRNFYGIEGLPTGIVMQKRELLGKDIFYSEIIKVYARKAIATLDVSAALTDSTVHIINNITFTDNYSGKGNTNLSLMIVEDSIIVAQLTPKGVVPDYRQNHVLRKMATPVWGNQITGSTAAKNSTFNYSGSTTIAKEWRRNYLSVVAILFDNDTKDVIQVAYTHITH